MAVRAKILLLLLAVLSCHRLVPELDGYETKYTWGFGEVNLAGWRTDISKSIVAMEELQGAGIGKDSIPSITKPWFVPVGGASFWVEDNEPVLLVRIGDEAKGYPLQILIWHQVVNDEIGGVEIAVTFCPLSYTGIVFDRDVDGVALEFGVSGFLRNSNLVMYDDKTETLWQQYTGQGLIGEYAGEFLVRLPSQIVSYAQFRRAFPDGVIMSKNTGYTRDYGLNPYVGYDYLYGTPFLYDGIIYDHIRPMNRVIAVARDQVSRAYPYLITRDRYILNDVLADQAIAIFHDDGAVSAVDARLIGESRHIGTTGVFSRKVHGNILTFERRNGYFVDDVTGSHWDIMGRCIEGDYEGTCLDLIDYVDAFAFSVLAFDPDSDIYEPDTEQDLQNDGFGEGFPESENVRP